MAYEFIDYGKIRNAVARLERLLYKAADAVDSAAEDPETRDLRYKRMDVYDKWVGEGYALVFEFCSQGAEPDAIYEAYAYDLQQYQDEVFDAGFVVFFFLAYSRDNVRERYYYDLSLPYSDEPIRYDEEVFDID